MKRSTKEMFIRVTELELADQESAIADMRTALRDAYAVFDMLANTDLTQHQAKSILRLSGLAMDLVAGGLAECASRYALEQRSRMDAEEAA